jgi:hypothetical protein
MTVLNTVCFNDLYLIIDLYRKVHPVNGVALFYLFKNTGIAIGKLSGFVKAFGNRPKKTIVRHMASI